GNAKADIAPLGSFVGNHIPFNLRGNDVVHLNGGNDNFYSGSGNDLLDGGIGNDTLNGGPGFHRIYAAARPDRLTPPPNDDIFVFNTRPNTLPNRDTITDFSNVAGNNDSIRLENAVMPGLGHTLGRLAADKFFVGPAAHDANDRIVYNDETGLLVYDSNGN